MHTNGPALVYNEKLQSFFCDVFGGDIIDKCYLWFYSYIPDDVDGYLDFEDSGALEVYDTTVVLSFKNGNVAELNAGDFIRLYRSKIDPEAVKRGNSYVAAQARIAGKKDN